MAQSLSSRDRSQRLADVEAADQAVLYPKNMAAYLIEQQVALAIARGQMDLDMRRSIRAGLVAAPNSRFAGPVVWSTLFGEIEGRAAAVLS